MNIWNTRFRRVKTLGLLSLVGLVVATLGYLTSQPLLVIGLLMVVPGFAYVYVITILHWKDRYIGKHSDAWGLLLLLETTGWLKLVYIFRHVLVDARKSGRYATPSTQI